MGNISTIVGLGSMIIGQLFSSQSQYMSMKQQKQQMAQQQVYTERCRDGFPPTVQTVNGQQVLVCPPTSSR
jgi:hypothetical protein